jgi:hypothetical protein
MKSVFPAKWKTVFNEVLLLMRQQNDFWQLAVMLFFLPLPL